MITYKSHYYKHNTIKYSNYIKLLNYLSQMCDDKEYHKCMIKLDRFKVVVNEE